MAVTPPVIVVAPTQRCGSTLLQRLLNSTREMICYGENFYLLQGLPDTLRGLHQNLPQRRQTIDRTMKLFTETDFDFEGSALFPDYDQYLAAARSGFFNLVKYYDDYSKSKGFQHWGIKHQIRGPQGYLFLRRLLPKARYVSIYRDVKDVARSAKARWPQDYAKPAAFTQLGASWHTNLRAMLETRDDENVLFFKYENFIAQPKRHLDQLEAFVGLSSIDRGVMERRVNNYPVLDAEDPMKAKNVYQKPLDLTAEETEALLNPCRELYEKLGYDRSGLTGQLVKEGAGYAVVP